MFAMLMEPYAIIQVSYCYNHLLEQFSVEPLVAMKHTLSF